MERKCSIGMREVGEGSEGRVNGQSGERRAGLSFSCRPVVANESITLSEAEPPAHTTPTPGERTKER